MRLKFIERRFYMITITKRDGREVPFNAQKIENAINKAFLEVDGQLYETDTAHDIADAIYTEAQYKSFTVEEIQDAVEDYLMRSERRDVARAYIRFRYKKEIARTKSLAFKKAIISKLLAKDVQNQNANVDEASFGGRTGEAASLVSKQLALDEFVSPMAKAFIADSDKVNGFLMTGSGAASGLSQCSNCNGIPYRWSGGGGAGYLNSTSRKKLLSVKNLKYFSAKSLQPNSLTCPFTTKISL